MIIARITDGLGNQMFQYAAARRLAYRHGTTLCLDTRWYRNHSFREVALDRFRVIARPVQLKELYGVCPEEAVLRWLPDALGATAARVPLALLRRVGMKSPWLQRTLDFDPQQPLRPLLQGRVVSERQFHFDAEVLSMPDGVAMCGYWQCERYFADVADIIKREFRPKAPLTGRNLECARAIESANSISLHVRRGDKVNSPLFCWSTLKYCKAVINVMRERVRGARFFVFSDDYAWAHKYLGGLADLVIVDHNDAASASEDLRLMSLCRHNIVAPSSFSWWGAWLNENPDKIVFSPPSREWLSFPNADTRDVFPEEWVVFDGLPGDPPSSYSNEVAHGPSMR